MGDFVYNLYDAEVSLKAQMITWIKGKKYLLAAVFFVIIAAIGGSYCYQISQAAAVATGTVATGSGSLTVRSGPGIDYDKIGSLAKGTNVTILGEEKGWYKIVYKSGNGYVAMPDYWHSFMSNTLNGSLNRCPPDWIGRK